MQTQTHDVVLITICLTPLVVGINVVIVVGVVIVGVAVVLGVTVGVGVVVVVFVVFAIHKSGLVIGLLLAK